MIEAMGAGRRAAHSIKAYLGLGETLPGASAEPVFGIPPGERNFVRMRVA